jgi:hypothetical protein
LLTRQGVCIFAVTLMRSLAAIAALLAPLALVAVVRAAPDAGADAGGIPACVQVQTDARYVPYGYDHIVTLTNGCSKPATCSVSTDVNPQPITAEVASGTTVEVVTFKGSPQTTFVARVTCALH